MLTSVFQDWTRAQMRRIATIFVNTPITPNMLTMFGLLINFGVAALLATGNLFWGGILIVFAGLFDLLDGALARITNRITPFGGFLDSSLDRYSEGVIYMGLLWYFLQRGRTLEPMLIFAVIVGSMMVSYTRARATALNVDAEVGIMARSERIGALAIALILSPVLPDIVTWALWLVAIGAQITTFQRILHVYNQTDKVAVRKPVKR